MNRIYKVIWSKVKHQYVVVSELAHSCTKSTGSRVGRSAAAVFAALVLTMGAGSVQADFSRPDGADYIQNDNGNLKVYDDGGVSFGDGAFNIGPDGQFRVPGENGDTYFTPDDLVSAVESGETASEAWDKADNAQGTANEAWNKADNAQGTANEAWNKADNAQ
ncbi:ESPR-type extended signal peptide-containing protein, partial [uncultured Megasphaera sp.]|uniref:ESPR-type extended signal peptide-containing protein n=1 Tax=uncultured Megasphaera sp. TaxID=165188 RepID=UPI0026340AF9